MEITLEQQIKREVENAMKEIDICVAIDSRLGLYGNACVHFEEFGEIVKLTVGIIDSNLRTEARNRTISIFNAHGYEFDGEEHEERNGEANFIFCWKFHKQ